MKAPPRNTRERNGVADRLGFEPKTALRLYSISSAAPSTGLGHLSATGKVYWRRSGGRPPFVLLHLH
jgi:hypothetical protein